MLRYITVFDPSRSVDENDTHKQLLLYHSFDDSAASLHDKLKRIGIIQGIWSLTESLNREETCSEKMIDLDDAVILTIKVESKYFISLSLDKYKDDRTTDIAYVPHQLYMPQLWYCYQFFTLDFGKLDDIKETRELTANLNEHFVAFWRDIILRPEMIIRRGMLGIWPEYCKMAELEIDSEQESWESIINQNILLEPESYLGIKDIFVYHLPNQNTTPANKKDKKLGFKTYGLVRNFTADLEISNELSNWIFHKHAVYDTLSSHVLAEATYYKEDMSEISAGREETNDFNHVEGGPSQSNSNFQESLQKQSKLLLHNLTLPITFAYDAVQEVSSTAGISSSMSLFMDYVPKWAKSNNDPPQPSSNPSNSNSIRARYGFLISPLCSSMLPMSYKTKVVKYTEKASGCSKTYQLLFWYYDNVLVVVVCDPNFSKIWESQYLQDLSYKLRLSMECFYRTAFNAPKHKENKPKKESFAYTILNKQQKSVCSSIPSGYSLTLRDNEPTPLKLVVEGFDQLLGTNNSDINRVDDPAKWGVDIMGGLFGNKDANTVNSLAKVGAKDHIGRTYESFFDDLDQDKKWDLQLQIISFIEAFKNSQVTKSIIEERLLKLNNGVLCYIKETESQLVIIVKNWFENEDNYKNAKSLLMTLGPDVYTWWNNLNQ